MSSIDTALEFVPELLNNFLKVIFVGKDCELKIASIAQAIIQSARPRSIIAPIQLGLGIQMHHHFASRFLIDSLNIILNEPQQSELKSIVVRVGGLHTEMSFLGCIGHLMAASGLQEVLEVVYATNAVIHMLSGKAIARAIRGHILIDAALSTLLVHDTFNNHVEVESIGIDDEAFDVASDEAFDEAAGKAFDVASDEVSDEAAGEGSN